MTGTHSFMLGFLADHLHTRGASLRGFYSRMTPNLTRDIEGLLDDFARLNISKNVAKPCDPIRGQSSNQGAKVAGLVVLLVAVCCGCHHQMQGLQGLQQLQAVHASVRVLWHSILKV